MDLELAALAIALRAEAWGLGPVYMRRASRATGADPFARTALRLGQSITKGRWSEQAARGAPADHHGASATVLRL